MSREIKVGISSCVLGDKVRFDGGHKLSRFVTKELSPHFSFVPVCPEVGAGLPVPRPTIRLVKKEQQIAVVETKDQSNDHTQAIEAFSKKKVEALAEQQLCGYIVCAKSPTCGMERVKVYGQHNAEKEGVGIYTRELMTRMPWLPVEEDGRLNDPVLKENFVTRVYCLNDFYQSIGDEPTRDKIVKFHSRYKLTLMAHHPLAYRKLGRLVAGISNYSIDEFVVEYRTQLMQALANRASRKNNTNVLMHLQGYFKRSLNKQDKAELRKVIDDYRTGLLPLLAPLTLIKHYLAIYPDAYLATQRYLEPYPQELRLRYAL
ncbi:YbgA family protein [Vibrio sonorensis]|uniref:YbgA family protein n=1 Tax=Vibrio sonorensis TaxID=1004316 RepID=UPI00111330FE|nr:DUF523 and DUF1722 domain-containing protein [Vibrio sonorensis]